MKWASLRRRYLLSGNGPAPQPRDFGIARDAEPSVNSGRWRTTLGRPEERIETEPPTPLPNISVRSGIALALLTAPLGAQTLPALLRTAAARRCARWEPRSASAVARCRR